MEALILFFTAPIMVFFLLKINSPKKKSLREIDFNYRPFMTHDNTSKFSKTFRKI